MLDEPAQEAVENYEDIRFFKERRHKPSRLLSFVQ
jgi:hypothetical protein